MKNLKEIYEQFKEVKFPQSPTNEALGDLFTDLVQYDSFIAGAIDKLLKGKPLKPNEIYFDIELEEKLKKFVLESEDKEDKRIANLYLLYLENLRNLIKTAELSK